MNPLELLQSSSLFGELDFPCLNRLAKNSHYKHAQKGEFLFFEGDVGDSFYLIASGRVRLFKSAGNDRETTIRFVSTGEIMGEVILFESDSYPVSAEVTEETKLLFLHRYEFIELLSEPKFRDAFFKILMGKQRYLAERVKVLSTLDVEERFLLYLIDRYDESGSYIINENKRDIAQEIGTIPETFSRMIKKMNNRSILEWKDNKIEIDKEYLAAILEEIRII